MNALRFALPLFLAFLWVGCSGPKGPVPVLKVGDKAATSTLMDATGHAFDLTSRQSGWYTALVFYRGSWCNTCENWLLELKKDISQFDEVHTALAAVSAEAVEDSSTFNNQWRFPFPLLSDTDFKLIDAYGFRDPKKGHRGEDISHVGVVLIDPQGVVRYIYKGNEAWDHPKNDEIIDLLKQLQAGKVLPTGGNHEDRF